LNAGAAHPSSDPRPEGARRERKKGPGPKGLGTGGLVKPVNSAPATPSES
jgi:hypothetical protein